METTQPLQYFICAGLNAPVKIILNYFKFIIEKKNTFILFLLITKHYDHRSVDDLPVTVAADVLCIRFF